MGETTPDGDRAAEAALPALRRMDAWMQESPWHPRIIPFAAYIVMLLPVDWLTDLEPRTYPLFYSVQCLLVVWLLWRYRRLTPELTGRFHWLAVPVGVGVFAAWVLLGWAMAGELPLRWQALVQDGHLLGRIEYGRDDAPFFATTERHFLDSMRVDAPAFYRLSNVLRLLGMAFVVPLFEEMFIRSLILRSMNRAGPTGTGLLQILVDLPLVGDWLASTKAGERAGDALPVFGREFETNALGVLTVFGVFVSTFIFMINHLMRDWPGCVVCGVAYCLLLAATRRKGLGPVVWAHGITNALLWAYTLHTGDWQFL